MRTMVMLASISIAAAIVACSSPKDAPATTTAQTTSPPVTAPPPATPPPSLVVGPGDPRFLDADLPPLPDNLPYAVEPVDVVRKVYTFAARHPEVLKFIPCFCGCEKMGHKGNDECFVKSRNAVGKVMAWEPHGVICEVCLDVATESMQLHNSGASAMAIRTYIDKKWSTQGSSHTNTPMPPADKSGGGD